VLRGSDRVRVGVSIRLVRDLPSPVENGKYWVASIDRTFSDTLGWSTSSGGTPGATPPGETEVAIYDSVTGKCTFDTTVVLQGLSVTSSFSNAIDQSTYSLRVDRSGITLNGGTFNGSNQVRCDGTFSMGSGAHITNTRDATIDLYGPSYFYDGFESPLGVYVVHGSDASCVGTAYFGNVRIDGVASTIDGTCYVDQGLYLSSGTLSAGARAEIHCHGDLICADNFGSWGGSNNAMLLMDGTKTQDIWTSNGAIIPGLTIDKTSEPLVSVWGSNSIQIAGDLLLYDGTVNTHGRHIIVGQA